MINPANDETLYEHNEFMYLQSVNQYITKFDYDIQPGDIVEHEDTVFDIRDTKWTKKI